MPSHWYLLHTKNHKEEFVCRQLRAAGFASFCPAIHFKAKTRRQREWRDCFPGYVFVRANPEKQSLSALNWLPGARGLIERDGEPVPLPDALLERVKRIFRDAGEEATAAEDLGEAFAAICNALGVSA